MQLRHNHRYHALTEEAQRKSRHAEEALRGAGGTRIRRDAQLSE